jgi:hypothetical protein
MASNLYYIIVLFVFHFYIIYNIRAQLLLWHVFVLCWSSSWVLCAKCWQCLGIVYSWFAIRFSLTFIKHWRDVNSKWMNCWSLSEVSKVCNRGVGAVTLSNYELMKWSIESVWLRLLLFSTTCNYSINKTPAVNYVGLMSGLKLCQMNHTENRPFLLHRLFQTNCYSRLE